MLCAQVPALRTVSAEHAPSIPSAYPLVVFKRAESLTEPSFGSENTGPLKRRLPGSPICTFAPLAYQPKGSWTGYCSDLIGLGGEFSDFAEPSLRAGLGQGQIWRLGTALRDAARRQSRAMRAAAISGGRG